MNGIDIPSIPRDGYRNRKGIIQQIVDDLEEEENYELPPNEALDDAEEELDFDADDIVAVDVHLNHGGVF